MHNTRSLSVLYHCYNNINNDLIVFLDVPVFQVPMHTKPGNVH